MHLWRWVRRSRLHWTWVLFLCNLTLHQIKIGHGMAWLCNTMSLLTSHMVVVCTCIWQIVNQVNVQLLFTALPIWNSWRPWGPCKPECGKGRSRFRTRTCNMQGKVCVGSNEDFQGCANSICKVDGRWIPKVLVYIGLNSCNIFFKTSKWVLIPGYLSRC